MAPMEGTEFGFVPAGIVGDLKDIGNWKVRAEAIESLRHSVAGLSPGDAAQLHGQIPGLLNFIVSLITDPNFKISITAMQILDDLLGKVGSQAEPHVPIVMPALINKLGDGKIVVRQANARLLLKMVSVLKAQAVLAPLTRAVQGESASARTKEEALGVISQAFTTSSAKFRESFDWAGTVARVAAAVGSADDRVRLAALECVAAARQAIGSDRLGSALQRAAPSLAPSVVRAIQDRVTDPSPPSLAHQLDVGITAGRPAPPAAIDASPAPGNSFANPGSLARAPVRQVAGAGPSTTAARAAHSGNSMVALDGPDSARARNATLGPVPGAALVSPPGMGASLGGRAHPGGALSSMSGARSPGRVSSSALRSSVNSHPGMTVVADPDAATTPRELAASQSSARRSIRPSRGGSRGTADASGVRASAGVPAGRPLAGEGASADASRTVSPRWLPASDAGSGGAGSRYGANGDASLALDSTLAPGAAPGGLAARAGYHPGPLSARTAQPSHAPIVASPDAGPPSTRALAARARRADANADAPPAGATPRQRRELRAASGSDAQGRWSPSSGGAAAAQGAVRDVRGRVQRKVSEPNAMMEVLPPVAAPQPHAASAREASRQTPARGVAPPSPPALSVAESRLTGASEVSGRDGPEVWLPNYGARAGRRSGAHGYYTARPSGDAEEVMTAGRTTGGHTPDVPLRDYGVPAGRVSGDRVSAGDMASQDAAQASPTSYARRRQSMPIRQERAGAQDAASEATSRDDDDGSGRTTRNAIRKLQSLTRQRRPTTNMTMTRGEPPSSAPAGDLPMTTGPLHRHDDADGRRENLGGGASRRQQLLATLAQRRRQETPSAGSTPTATNSSGPDPFGQPPSPRRAPSRASTATNSHRGNGSVAAGGGPLGAEDRASPKAELATADLKPCSSPEADFRRAMADLEAAKDSNHLQLDWGAQFDALNMARRLVVHHGSVVAAHLRAFVLAILPAVDSLRSLTAKTAIMLVQEMFVSIPRALDAELEYLAPALFKRTGEVSNAGRENFIVQEADMALVQMVTYCNEVRTSAILLAQAAHRNPVVRGKVAGRLDDLLAMHGQRLATANRDVLDRVLQVALNFLDEGSLDTRTYGKRMVWELRRLYEANGLGFEAALSRHAKTDQKRRQVSQVLDSSGAPPVPAKRSAAPSRAVSRGLTRTNSSASDNGDDNATRAATGPPRSRQNLSRLGSVNRRRRDTVGEMGPRSASAASGAGAGGLDSSVMEEKLAGVVARLASRDWRERSDALHDLEVLFAKEPLRQAPESVLVSATDALTQRMNDGNSKVCAQALVTLRNVLPHIGDGVAAGLNTMFPVLAGAVGSTNDKVRVEAVAALDALIGSVDRPLLVQHFSHCVSHGPTRGKATLLLKLREVAIAVAAQRPGLVQKHIIPASLTLLSELKQDVRQANTELLRSLHGVMGPELLESAAGLSMGARRKLMTALGLE